MADDDLGSMSTNNAAARLGITLRTAYRFIDTGDLPAYKFVRVTRSRGGDVDAFTETSQAKPDALTHLHLRLDDNT